MNKFNKDTKFIAERYGFNEKTIINWINKGCPLANGRKIKLEGFMLVGRRFRFDVDIVDNFIKEVNHNLELQKDILSNSMKAHKVNIINNKYTSMKDYNEDNKSDCVKRLEKLLYGDKQKNK